MDTNTAPTGTEGQVAEATPSITPEGQANTGADTESQQQPSFNDELTEFYQKKGWTPDNGLEQLFKSYTSLESKLGNWQETERRARELDSVMGQTAELREKAQRWEQAQQHLKELEEQQKLESGQLDISQAPTEQLAKLWQSGRIGLSDLPANRQYEVQQHVNAMDKAIEAQATQEAQQLAEKHPILKNPEVAELIAAQIEQGVKDPRTGKELSPEEIIAKYENLISLGAKQREEQLKKDTELLKNANLERPGAPVSTISNTKTKSVFDAYNWAKSQQGKN